MARLHRLDNRDDLAAHQLPRDPWHLFDANIFHPATGTLAFSDAMLLVSAFGAPVIWSGASAPVVHNLLLGAAFVSVPTLETLWLYETTYQIRSIHHWQPLVNGYSGFAPLNYRRTLESLRGFPDEASIERLRQLKVRFMLLNRVYYGEAFTGLIARVADSPAFGPPRSFGDADDQIIVVELKETSTPR